ncbi:MAG: helicase-related protein [Pseudomonadota bacterium]
MANLSLSEWLSRTEGSRRFRENATSITHIPASAGSFAPYPEWVNHNLHTVLTRRGMSRLYSHQAHAVALIRQGKDVVLITPTASGKTLCYNLPVLQKILDEPETHAENLLEREVALIDESGAPRAQKTFILYNPPIINRELGIRQSALTPARKIASKLIANKIQTIIFTTSRLNVEVLTKYLKDIFRSKIPASDHYVTGYRGGYLPMLRRDIEKGLRDRSVMGVVSTNALELGIDIGDMEACIMAGYPGSIASAWQQAGRAGRRAGRSLAILIAKSNPMDQFIVQNPDYFFTRSPEHCRVNPDNLIILLHHIKSAAFELPFEQGERFGKEDLMELLGYLEEKGVLHRVGQRWHWAADSYPADEVSLRSINPENVVVVDTTDAANHKVIAEVDWDSAFTTVHDDAIYMVESQQYHVDKLDLERKKAYVRKVDVDYYTDAMTYTNVRVMDDFAKKMKGGIGFVPAVIPELLLVMDVYRGKADPAALRHIRVDQLHGRLSGDIDFRCYSQP